MKKFLSYVFIAAVAVAASSCGKDKGVSAEAQGAGTRIGVVEMAKVNSEAKVMRSLNKQKDAKVEEVQDSVKKKRAEFEKKEADLKQKQLVMSQEAFAKEATAFQKEVIDYDRSTQQKLQAIEKGYIDALKKIQEDYLSDIVKDIGRAAGYDMILNSQAAVVLNKDLIVTNKIIDELDRKVQEIELKVK
ncbi:MAG: OmpH family outer membrane protein [Rickettsiales bacterium]|jgi:Skp family chaperone for outer membrane proteins|nr:OmpH family outer membrane protein [Rickettsiales bacterium]